MEQSTPSANPDLRFLSGNTLKIIAAVSMFLDHLGYVFFPRVAWLRAVGRLAFPLFAFLLAEGCRYTKNKTKHFALLFVLGTVCQVVFYLFTKQSYMGILLSFSLSTLCIYAVLGVQKSIAEKNGKHTALYSLALVCSVAAAWAFCYFFEVDYGFWGCMFPVFCSLIDFRSFPAMEKRVLLEHFLRVAMAAIALVLVNLSCAENLAFLSPALQWYSLFTIPLLLLYNGKKGKGNLKYFFYIFYPAHLAALQGVAMLLSLLK
ncbi:MAG: hypothetical protein IJV80_03600 [Clostridia bacterium]|nr:hypothetical protein [Clostridia bacterium]